MSHRNPPSAPSLIYQRTEHLVTEFEGEIVGLNSQTDTYFKLNHVGSLIWALLEQPVTVADIVRQLLEKFEVEPSYATDRVEAYLKTLSEKKLIKVTQPCSSNTNCPPESR